MKGASFLAKICSFLGFAYFLFIALIAINNAISIVDLSEHAQTIEFIQKYGALIILGILVFTNFIGRTVVKIVFVVLLLGVGLLYVLSTFAPGIIQAIFGGKGAPSGEELEAVVRMLTIM